MVQDLPKMKYLETQDAMDRNGLDGQKSMNRLVDFYEEHTADNPEWVPEMHQELVGVHLNFEEGMKFPLGDFQLTPEKSKEVLKNSKSLLYSLVLNYEKSGNGSMQCTDDDNDWGKFDLENCNNQDDDHKNFLKNGKNPWLLYWWAFLQKLTPLHQLGPPKLPTANAYD